MTFKNIVGFIMVVGVLVGLFVFTAIDIGVIKAGVTWGVAIVLTVIIVAGIHLAIE